MEFTTVWIGFRTQVANDGGPFIFKGTLQSVCHHHRLAKRMSVAQAGVRCRAPKLGVCTHAHESAAMRAISVSM